MSEVADKVKDLSLKDKKKKPTNPLYLDPQPEFIEERIKLFDELKAQYGEEISKK